MEKKKVGSQVKGNIGIAKNNLRVVCREMTYLLADTYLVYLKTQNCHWNVKGPHFVSLHRLFEQQYTELAEAIDEIAERLVALGSYVNASFLNFKKESRLQEIKSFLLAEKMIDELLSDHERIICFSRKLSLLAEKARDLATVDLMAKRIAVHEKSAWILRSLQCS